jgi:hypothetical protein
MRPGVILWRMTEPVGSATVPESAHRFELVGPLDDLDFPELCPVCGAKATGALDVRKVFLNTEGEDRRHVLAEVRVPFCSSCIAQHEREAKQQPRVRAYRFPKILDFALVSIWGVMGVFFLYVAASVSGGGGAIPALILTYMGIACLAFWVLGVRGASRVPWYERVPPQTSVTNAFDFGDETLELFEKSARRYSIRNAEFAERFAALNAEKRPRRNPARVRWKAIVLLIVMLAILAAIIIWGERIGMT